MKEFNYQLENKRLKQIIRDLKKEVSDYRNRYKQLSGSKRELRIESKVIKEEYLALYQDYTELVYILQTTIERFEDLSNSLINDAQQRIIREELDFLKKRRSLVSSITLEDSQGEDIDIGA